MASVTGVRGDGDREADDVSDSLLATQNARIERARTELNLGEAMKEVDLETRYQAGLRAAEIVQVLDAGEGEAYAGRVTDWSHADVNGGGAITNLTIEYPEVSEA